MLTCRLRSVYVPSTFHLGCLSACHCLPVTVCLALPAWVSVGLPACLPVCLSHLNTCAPLMHSNVRVPPFVFRCARSIMDVPRIAFQCARSTACLAMCTPIACVPRGTFHYIARSACVPLCASHKRSNVCIRRRAFHNMGWTWCVPRLCVPQTAFRYMCSTMCAFHQTVLQVARSTYTRSKQCAPRYLTKH